MSGTCLGLCLNHYSSQLEVKALEIYVQLQRLCGRSPVQFQILARMVAITNIQLICAVQPQMQMRSQTKEFIEIFQCRVGLCCRIQIWIWILNTLIFVMRYIYTRFNSRTDQFQRWEGEGFSGLIPSQANSSFFFSFF